MPLSVEVRINGHLIEKVHIGRLEELRGTDKFHEYQARVEGDPESDVLFHHRYDEGALMCVEKALLQINEKRRKRAR